MVIGMATLRTTKDVIEALGGTKQVALMTGREYPAAFNWRSFETFPPDTYLVLTAALAARGFSAPPSLWRMIAPVTPAANAANQEVPITQG